MERQGRGGRGGRGVSRTILGMNQEHVGERQHGNEMAVIADGYSYGTDDDEQARAGRQSGRGDRRRKEHGRQHDDNEETTANAGSPWAKSRAKRFCCECLLDENNSIHEKTAEQVFTSLLYPDGEPVLLGKYELKKFKANFKRLKDKKKRDKEISASEELSFQIERRLYPRSPTDYHGNPYYAGSALRSTLIFDVKSGVAATSCGKTPSEISQSRPVYSNAKISNPKWFRNHLYRERRYQNEPGYWRSNQEGFTEYHREVAMETDGQETAHEVQPAGRTTI